MFYLITDEGLLLTDATRTSYDEVMRLCARIGYKP